MVAAGLDSTCVVPVATVGFATAVALGLTSTNGVFLLTSDCAADALLEDVAERLIVLGLACLAGGGADGVSNGSSLISSMISSATKRELPSGLFLKFTDLRKCNALNTATE